jgi:predicted AlkP superfamily pyrophosphatase or phosphodiesterase
LTRKGSRLLYNGRRASADSGGTFVIGFKKVILTCCVAALVATHPLPARAAGPPSAQRKPTLIVAIAVDQFSAGIFDQYRNRFTSGLRRIIDAGVVFPNGYQSHAATETCPGHSTLLTGKHPSGTGIIANEWLGPDGKTTYCLADPGMTVPGRPTEPRGPANLRTSTLGEWLKAQNPASRVVAVSGKDRAAINMSGHGPDAVFWWDDELGFNTYVPPGADPVQRLQPVKAINESIAKRWNRKLPAWKPLDASCSRLNSEGTYGETWHVTHHVPPDWKLANPGQPIRSDKAFKRWVRASPIVDELTLEVATSFLNRYQLGRGTAPDLLAISLSATDYIGHRYGNEGPEMCDQMAHLDRGLGAFFKTLDATKVPYVVVLTADHGGIDAAERVQLKGFPAERMTADVAGDVNRDLRNSDLRLGFDAFEYVSYGLYFVRSANITTDQRQKIVETAVEYLNRQSWVSKAFAKTAILNVRVRAGVPPDEMSLEERFSESVDAERSADVLIAYKPYTTMDRVDPNGYYIAEHGSPWNYDRRVPIVFWRPGFPGYEQYLPIETVDIAPTLAALVAVPHPAIDGRCIDLDSGIGNTCSSIQ